MFCWLQKFGVLIVPILIFVIYTDVGVQHILCCVFLSIVLPVPLWIVHVWFHLRYSLKFICKSRHHNRRFTWNRTSLTYGTKHLVPTSIFVDVRVVRSFITSLWFHACLQSFLVYPFSHTCTAPTKLYLTFFIFIPLFFHFCFTAPSNRHITYIPLGGRKIVFINVLLVEVVCLYTSWW